MATAHPTRALDQLTNRLATSIDGIVDRISGKKPTPAGTNWSWPGIYLGAGDGGSVWSGPEHHVLVIGPPRSGKTSSFVIPTIALHWGPIVVTSTKSDVVAATAARRRQYGRCWLWDPTGKTPLPPGVERLRWSPVSGCDDWDTAVARAWALASAARPGQQYSEGGHWVERGQALLAPLLHAAALSEADLATVLTWLQRRQLDQALEVLRYHRSRVAHNVLTGINASEERERSGIFSTADSILAAYRTNAALEAASHPNFDPDAFVHSADTLYICAPSAAHHQSAPLVVTLLQQLRDAIGRRPRPWPPVIWALDELANIAPLPDLPGIVADSAAQGLLILACLQDLSQARARWGTAADGFLTLFPTKAILPGVADLPTLRLVSAIAGEHEVRRTATTHPALWFTGGASASKTLHDETRPRLSLHTIARGEQGTALLLTGTEPSHLRLTPCHSSRGTSSLLAPSIR